MSGLTIVISALMLSAASVSAQTIGPSSYFGTVTLQGVNLPAGATITATSAGDTFTTTNVGIGRITPGVSDYTIFISQPLGKNYAGQIITFSFQGATATTTWSVGDHRVDLNLTTGRPRKVIFILGINSQGYLTCAEDPSTMEEFNNLRSVLANVISDKDIVWLSYRHGQSAYCDGLTETYQKPNYSQLDTCDGIDEPNEVADELDRLVGRLIERSPNVKFDIVGHSMGGVAASYWATRKSEEFLRKHIHSIITLDSPLNGTTGAAIFQLTWVCGIVDPNGPSVIDLTFEDLPVISSILQTDADGSNILTSRVNFVHGNSTGIGDLLPGYWREDHPPCRQVFNPFRHDCMLDQPSELGAIRRAVRADVSDDRSPNFNIIAGQWEPDRSEGSTDGWVRGSAQKTHDKTPASVRMTNVVGSVVRVLYTGEAAAQVSIDGASSRVMPDEGACSRYPYGHGGTPTRPPLCQYLVPTSPGAHTVDITTIPECRIGNPNGIICVDPRDFFFDAIEAFPALALRFEVRSPVNILVIDPDGRRVGFDPSTGTVVNEIPGATYSGPGSEPQVVQIPTMLPGSYEMLLTGTGTGDFHISVETISEGGFVESLIEVEGTATEGSQHLLEFNAAAEGDLARVVDIDIKPGSDPNSINCNSPKAVIAVAVLTTGDSDATEVDHTSVTFEGATETHVDKKTGEPLRHEEDVDGDGDTDLVFHFRLGDTTLTCNSTAATLTGETFDNQDIQGTDAVRMTGE